VIRRERRSALLVAADRRQAADADPLAPKGIRVVLALEIACAKPPVDSKQSRPIFAEDRES
jgi:hypothetical protein